MEPIVTEKNDVARQIARLPVRSAAKREGACGTPVCRFGGRDERAAIGPRGRIPEPDFAPNLVCRKVKGKKGARKGAAKARR